MSLFMIKLITGKKGSGKTKILIDQINNAVKDTNGCLVCVEKGETLRRSISYKVRWCDAEQFAIDSFAAFYGFVAGMLAGNYDTNVPDRVFLVIGEDTPDGADFDEFGLMLGKLDKLTGEDVTVAFTVSADNAELPSSVTKFLD